MAHAAKLKNEEQARAAGAPRLMTGAFGKLAGYPRRARQFLHEVRSQMRLVTWPSWNDVYSTTLVVIIAVAFFALFFYFTDSTLGYATQWVLKRFKH